MCYSSLIDLHSSILNLKKNQPKCLCVPTSWLPWACGRWDSGAPGPGPRRTWTGKGTPHRRTGSRHCVVTLGSHGNWPGERHRQADLTQEFIFHCSFFILHKMLSGVTVVLASLRVSNDEVVATKLHMSRGNCLFVCLVGFLTSTSTTGLYHGLAPRQSVWQFYVLPHIRHRWETMSSVFCLSRLHYTDTDPTSRERAATAGIEPAISPPGVARSTGWDHVVILLLK